MNQTFNSFAKAYECSLKKVMLLPQFVSKPRDKEIKEVLNLSFCINNPLNNLFENAARTIPLRYLAGELSWYFSGSNRVEDIQEYSSFWNAIKNTDNTVNSAYGYILFKKNNQHNFTQWQWALDSLLNDKESRQAIMYFGGSDYQYENNKDFVCTCFGHFLIRNNQLHFMVTMRSNDLIRGMTFDVPFFMLLQQNMLLLLKEKYPELTLGSYYHTANSAHVYEEHYDLAHDMLVHDFKSIALPEMLYPIVDKTGNQTEHSQPLLDWIASYK